MLDLIKQMLSSPDALNCVVLCRNSRESRYWADQTIGWVRGQKRNCRYKELERVLEFSGRKVLFTHLPDDLRGRKFDRVLCLEDVHAQLEPYTLWEGTVRET